MVMASQVGLGRATGQDLRSAFSDSMTLLCAKGLNFGAHTDDHAQKPNCGCGAIDKAPQSIESVARFATDIHASIVSLGVDDVGLDSVIANFGRFAEDSQRDTFRGADVMGEIVGRNKVVKELTGPHKEMFIILNTVAGYTVDQGLARRVSNDAIQFFAVDVWRMQQIAETTYADSPLALRHQALLSELAYTLGVAAVLTKGDLPVYLLQRQ